MYKCKIVFLYKDSEDNCKWSHKWIDWDGQDTDELSSILEEYKKKEKAALKKDNMDAEVQYAMIVECDEITDGKYFCNKCDCYFNELDDGTCPYCNTMSNWVETKE